MEEISSSSGLTIKEFLTRYPEVKRLSSRFNEEGEDIVEEVTTEKLKKQKNSKKTTKKPPTLPPTTSPFFGSGDLTITTATEVPTTLIIITPKQRQVPTTEPPVLHQQPPQGNHPQQQHLPPQQQSPLSQQHHQLNQQPPDHRQQQQQQQHHPGVPPKNSGNGSPPHQQQQRPHQNQQQPAGKQGGEPAEYDNPFDYDYYYDQLVPEHERFFQLPKTAADPLVVEEPQPLPVVTKNEPFQVFTHFAIDSAARPPNGPAALPPAPSEQDRAQKSVQGAAAKQPKAAKVPKVAVASPNSIGSPAKGGGDASSGNMAGPYGYTEKGTFFIDDQTVGFPEKMEMVYQGFVWAFDVIYPDQTKVRHGGVHRILEDKVKRETLDLRNDHIVRITGRASPYNINRLTFYTANGRQFGPWGDRHSDESADFEVTAPPGHALAFFSGTIDFGVPLRSVSFHWRPL